MSEGPEPVYDPLLQPAVEIAAALAPNGSWRRLGGAVRALCLELERSLAEIAVAIGTWPPPLESQDAEPLSSRAAALSAAAAAVVTAHRAEAGGPDGGGAAPEALSKQLSLVVEG